MCPHALGIGWQKALSGEAQPPAPPRSTGLALPAVPHFLQLRPSTPSQGNPSSLYLQEFSWILSLPDIPFPFKNSYRKDKRGPGERGEADGMRSARNEVAEAQEW